LTLKTIGILRRVALYSRSPEFDDLSRLRAEARPVCHFTVAMPPCPDVMMPAPTKRDPRAVAEIRQRRAGGTNLVMLHSVDQRVI